MVPPHTTQVVLLKCRLFGVACWGHIPHTVQYMEMDSVYSSVSRNIFCMQVRTRKHIPYTFCIWTYFLHTILYMESYFQYSSRCRNIFHIHVQIRKWSPHTIPRKACIRFAIQYTETYSYTNLYAAIYFVESFVSGESIF